MLAWTPILPPLSLAALMIWSQVTGCSMSIPALSTKDLRYQRTWVLDQNGATTSWSSQVAAADALSKACSLNVSCMSCGISAR